MLQRKDYKWTETIGCVTILYTEITAILYSTFEQISILKKQTKEIGESHDSEKNKKISVRVINIIPIFLVSPA